MGQALYRKYRSKSLAEVVGQEHITQTLEQALKNGRISHAYLFTGPRGTGKTSIARILAHEINQLPYNDQQHLDIIEIDAASNRRIDDIRDLRDKVHLAPTSAKYKVYIIDEVHMLTGESFNALLKTLEEPPAHVVFILATTEVHKLPATIVSRTQRYSFRPMDTQKGIAHLKHIAKLEKITIDDEALALIVEHGAGSFRDSISLLDQLANVSNGNITTEIVQQTLGLAPRSAIDALVHSVVQQNHPEVAEQLTALENSGTTTASLLPQLISALQTVAQTQPRLYGLIDTLLEVPRAYNPRLKLLTTLMAYAIDEQKAKPKNAPISIAPLKPVLDIAKETPEKSTVPRPKLAPEQTIAHAPLAQLTPEQWATVTARIRQLSPPFFAILRMAQPDFDADTQTLTLKFTFQLHRKKMEDSKQKSLLVKTMIELLDGAPIIKTEIDASAVPPTVKPTPPEAVDATASSVIAMMGGGEVINNLL